MWKRLLQRFESWMVAVTFAEAGERETALAVLARGERARR